jgi:DNA-binding NtrC family response regulator
LAVLPPPNGLEEGRRLRVLVVDDQEVVHWGFKTLLARRAWVENYCAASSTEEALEIAARDHPHVALVGAVVGYDSGAEVTRQLHEVSPDTRVLLMATTGSPRAPRAPPGRSASCRSTGRRRTSRTPRGWWASA